MQLEDQLSAEKARSERQRLANEQNHIYRMHLLSKLENDHQLYNPYDERKAHSENGKDKLVKVDDVRGTPYKYFSNSARYPEREPIRGRYSEAADNLMEIADNEQVTVAAATGYCRRCHPRGKPTRNICDRCARRQRRHEFCIRCNEHLHSAVEQTSGICEKCQIAETNCAFCRRHDDVCDNCRHTYCVRCRRQATEDVGSGSDAAAQPPPHRKRRQPPQRKPKPMAYEVLQESSGESEHDLDGIEPIVVRHPENAVPFSVNVPRHSMFHPNSQTVANVVDERIANYVRNYGDLRTKKSRPVIVERSVVDDPFPLPLMRDTAWPHRHERTLAPEQSPAVKMLDSKWTIPAVEKNSITTKKPIRVLTQLGAVRRQLQMEKLNLN